MSIWLLVLLLVLRPQADAEIPVSQRLQLMM